MKPTGPAPAPPVAKRIASLIDGFLRGRLTEAEHAELDAWVESSESNMRLFEELTDEHNIRRGFRPKHQTVRLRRWLPYAAAVLILIAGFLWWRPNGWRTEQTAAGISKSIVLDDGTKVWLNAASVLRFKPGARKAQLQGEAYFEVKKDSAHPFMIETSDGAGQKITVTVLGTRFDINSYGDEGVTAVRLLEGSLRVRRNDSQLDLKPGEQGIAGKDLVKESTDTSRQIGWINGRSTFDRVTLRTIGAELSRWYNIKVTYSNTGAHYSLRLDRRLSLQQQLDFLQHTLHIQSRLVDAQLTLSDPLTTDR